MRPGAAARGFTLIELLVTLAILGIVTTLAVGGYREYLRRANRTDATTALLRISAAQEKFYVQNGQYAGDAELAGDPPAGLGIAGTERGYYTLAIAIDPGGPTIGYTATATADAAGAQGDDEGCWSFSINERGVRSAADDGGATGAAVTERCWR
ncbi:MAG: type IV pilin protein [Gammaproteobacteria bacterium]|nr:MAG: type IV pilin protein [Gammaproteobacteria bacterium]